LSHAPPENAESYITKEAARELKNKLSGHGEKQDLDYDDILTKIIMSVHQPSDDNAEQIVYEKKYFDYLPNDLDSEDVTEEDSTHELIKSFDDVMSTEHDFHENNERRVNSRKFKRDLTSQSRQKRQGFFIYPLPLVHYSPYQYLNFYFPDDIPLASSIQSRFDAPPNNNPWHPANNPKMKFHPPSNFYLPAMPGLTPDRKWVTIAPQFDEKLIQTSCQLPTATEKTLRRLMLMIEFQYLKKTIQGTEFGTLCLTINSAAVAVQEVTWGSPKIS
jgi:hypothetical protein